MKPLLEELDRAGPAVGAVGSVPVVVGPPVLGEDLRLEEARELLAAQGVVAHPAVEALGHVIGSL